MDTENNVSIDELVNAAVAAEETVKEAQRSYENCLKQIVSASGSSTFCHNGKWYQVRTRADGDRTITYLCNLRDDPRTWLKGRPKGVTAKRKKTASLSDVDVAMANATHVVAENADPTEDTDTILE